MKASRQAIKDPNSRPKQQLADIDYELVRTEFIRRVRAGEDPSIEEIIDWVLASPKAPARRESSSASTTSASTTSGPKLRDIELEGDTGNIDEAVGDPEAILQGTQLEQSQLDAALGDMLEKSPWWLLSVALHMLLLAILALVTLWRPPEESELSYRVALFEEIEDTPEPGVQITDPVETDVVDEILPESEPEPVPEPEPLPHEIEEPAEEVPDPPVVTDEPTATLPSEEAAELASLRTGLAHEEAIAKYGGSAASENAVKLGLDWLERHQDLDGKWSADGFGRHCEEMSCWGTGYSDISEGLTGLALLSFLGAGHTHVHSGRYRDAVARGLLFLRRLQEEDGCFGPRTGDSGYLYEHSIATLVMAEAYAMTGDKELREPVERAVDFLESCQQKGGGWDYTEYATGRDDTSITGWVVMALKSARLSGIEVDSGVWKNTRRFFGRATRSNGEVVYANKKPAHGRSGIGMSAVGLLCRLYLGESSSKPELRKMAQLVGDDPPSYDQLYSNQFHTMYYWYYGTLGMFQVGGERWQKWNAAMRDTLVDRQVRAGHAIGSWDPEGPWLGVYGGRIYSTALCILNLEIYYRYLPIYARTGGGVDDLGEEPEEIVLEPTPRDTIQEAIDLASRSSSKDRARGVRMLIESDGSAAAIEALILYLDDDASTIRWQAINGLKQHRANAAVTSLIERLPREETFLKKQIVDALGAIGNADALPALETELRADERSLNPRICAALGLITGEKHGNDRAGWLRYLSGR